MADAVPASSAFLGNMLMNPPNPMETLGKTANALTGVREFQAKQAIADAYRQATDPVTGEVDQGKLNAIISQTPGAFLQGQAMEQGGRGVQAQAAGTSASVQAAQDQLGAIGNVLGPLYQKAMDPNGGGISVADANAALDAVVPGTVPGNVLDAFRKKINALGPNGDATPVILGAGFATTHAMEVLNANKPQTTAVTTGPNVQYPATNPLYKRPTGGLPNVGQPGATIGLGLSPENVTRVQQWLTEPFEWDDGKGNKQQGTKGSYLQFKGIDPMQYFSNGNVPAPGSAPPSGAAASGPVGSVTTGRAAVGAPNQPAAPAVVPPAPAPAAGPSTSVGTTSEQLPAATLEAGQKDYIAAQASNAGMSARIAPLNNALSLLRTNPDLQTGPGVAQWNQAVTGAAAALNLPVPKGTSDIQELTKYLAQYVRNQNTGGQTDLGRLETEAANPNPTTQSREALQVLTAKAVGVELFRQKPK